MKLKNAIDKGYVIIKIYEVYHWEESSWKVFAEYVNVFLSIKQESSGYPEWVETEEDNGKYIRSYQQTEGVVLIKENIRHNPDHRAVAKLALNSFWRENGERANKTTAVKVWMLPMLLNSDFWLMIWLKKFFMHIKIKLVFLWNKICRVLLI